MKRIITLISLALSLSASAQRISVHGQSSMASQETIPDSIFNKHLYEAGQYLNKAADFEAITIGCAVVSFISFQMIQDKETRNLAGWGFALAATGRPSPRGT